MALGCKEQRADVQGVPALFGNPCGINPNEFPDTLDKLIGLDHWNAQA